MGVYDYLKGKCPDCGFMIGSDSGDIQIKWFSEPAAHKYFRVINEGDKLPGTMPDGEYQVDSYEFCCGKQEPLLAIINNNKFIGFKRSNKIKLNFRCGKCGNTFYDENNCPPTFKSKVNGIKVNKWICPECHK